MKRKSLIISLLLIAAIVVGELLHRAINAPMYQVDVTVQTRHNDIATVADTTRVPDKSVGSVSATGDDAPPHIQSSDKQKIIPSPPNSRTKNLVKASPNERVRLLYADLIRDLYLRPEDADLLVNYLYDMQSQIANLRDGSPMERAKRIEAVRAEGDKNVMALLGSAGFSQYKQYEKDLSTHVMVLQVSDQANIAGTSPLTRQQKEDLFLALKKELATPNLTSIDQLQQRVAQTAESILTPEQFAQYRQAQERRNQQRPPTSQSTIPPT